MQLQHRIGRVKENKHNNPPCPIIPHVIICASFISAMIFLIIVLQCHLNDHYYQKVLSSVVSSQSGPLSNHIALDVADVGQVVWSNTWHCKVAGLVFSHKATFCVGMFPFVPIKLTSHPWNTPYFLQETVSFLIYIVLQTRRSSVSYRKWFPMYPIMAWATGIRTSPLDIVHCVSLLRCDGVLQLQWFHLIFWVLLSTSGHLPHRTSTRRIIC